MIFFDTETCGLHGIAVLIQYAEDDDEINLHEVWNVPIQDTLDLIEWIANHEICGFNLAFDWFHINKLYSIFYLLKEKYGNVVPNIYVEEIAALEKPINLCVKPKAACDLMLHARKGEFQSTMERKPIKIKKVPVQAAKAVQELLEKNLIFDDIYFDRRKIHGPQWQIEGEGDFRDIVLRFKASGSLKSIAKHIFGGPKTRFNEIGPPSFPAEVGWAPFALGKDLKIGKKRIKGHWWPRHIISHIDHWSFNKSARSYAEDDVRITRDLYYHFGNPIPGDNDSELACSIGCCRWFGYNVELDCLNNQKHEINENLISPSVAKIYISEVMDEIEQSQFKSTKDVVLETIENWQCDCQNQKSLEIGDLTLDFGESEGECKCDGDGIHPAAKRAKEVRKARHGKKRNEVFDKILTAKRLHPDFKIIGTLSGRMSGASGLSLHGVPRDSTIRNCFKLADEGFVLSGGDFDAFEVVLTDAAYPDSALRAKLKEGKKIHGLFAMKMFPGMTYDEILLTKGSEIKDYYTLGKNGVFSMIYGGDAGTLVRKYGIDEDAAEQAFEEWKKEYPDQIKERQKILDKFQTMRQPKGIGTKVEWHEPAEYVESIFGFKRYFTLENRACKVLFNLAQNHKIKIPGHCTRRDRIQTIGGAVSTALYAAAFSIQSSNMRAACNHVIQSSGAQITKEVQRKIWDLQPIGVSDYKVIPLNVHDEVMVPNKCPEKVEEIVHNTVESFRDKVPLIKIDWSKELESWGEK